MDNHFRIRTSECNFVSKILTCIFSVFFFSRQGSVRVDFQLLINSKSNVTIQAINQTLLSNNRTNNQGFIFGNILVQGKLILVLSGRQSKGN